MESRSSCKTQNTSISLPTNKHPFHVYPFNESELFQLLVKKLNNKRTSGADSVQSLKKKLI